MPYNGAGIFTQIHSWVADAANSVLITASRFQATYDDMATALGNCVTRDGQSPALANLPLGGFKITGMADGSAAQDAVTVSQVAALASVTYTTRVQRTSSQTVAPAATATIVFNSVILNALSEWNVATGVFTAAAAGLYRLDAVIQAHVVTGGNSIFPQIVAAATARPFRWFVPTVLNNQIVTYTLSFTKSMVAGDTARVEILNSTAGNLVIAANSECQMTKIGS